MGNRRLHIIERIHALGMPESERLKVIALNLFHPTASPLFEKVGFFILRHSLQREKKTQDLTPYRKKNFACPGPALLIDRGGEGEEFLPSRREH